MGALGLMSVLTFLIGAGQSLFTDLVLSPEKMIWDKSEDYCKNNNGRLIVLDSQEKWNNFTAHDHYRQNNLSIGRYWIGMRFNETIACDTTREYLPWVYSGWARWSSWRSEPNSCPKQRCIRLDKTYMLTFNCDQNVTALCETGSSEPTTTIQGTTSSDPYTMTTEIKAAISSATHTTSLPASPADPADKPTTGPCNTTNASQTDVSSYVPNSTMRAQDVIEETTPVTSKEIKGCDRCCRSTHATGPLSQQKRDEIKRMLIAQLTVNKSSLSVYTRKRISVYDPRSSSVAMGSVASAILATVVGVITIPDIITLFRSVNKLQNKHKIKPRQWTHYNIT